MNICLSCEGVTATVAQRCGHCGSFLLPLDSVHYPNRRGEADAGNPLLGSVVDGKYRLQGVLGRGGLGTVFQAEHVGSLMKVAVKLLHPRFSERPEYRRALLPEARRAATVTNERCARLLDVGETADRGTYLAMELVDGATLDSLVRSGPLAPSHAVDILVQVAEALVAIHAAGLVHCDLSPRNVMVSMRHGALAAKVLDFGIARSVSVTAAQRLGGSEFAGFANPAFSAPEHLAGREVDPRADLYSLGALAWLLLTGSAPIEDGESHVAARAVVAGDLRPWPNPPGVPRRLQRWMIRCLALDPADRPQTASAVLRELLAVRGGRRPRFARSAVTALVLSGVALAVSAFESATPYLHSVPGPLVLSDQLPPTPIYLHSSQLATLQFHFGGFWPERLRLVVSREGAVLPTVLRRAPLRPEVDEAGGTLTLSVAQPEWSSVVRSLLDSSREDAVDLSFMVPGHAPLGSARLRLDDEPPVLLGALLGTVVSARGDVLSSAVQLEWQANDAIALAEVVAHVRLGDGSQHAFPLLGSKGTFPLGRELMTRVEGCTAIAGVEVRLVARDRAGNESVMEVGSLSACDVRAPTVAAATGAEGDAVVSTAGGVARLRVRLSAAEPGCELTIRDAEGREHSHHVLSAAGVLHEVEMAVPGSEGALGSTTLAFCVQDAAGNQTEQAIGLTFRDRSVRLQFFGETPGFTILGTELVVCARGAQATLRCAESYRLVRASVVGLASAAGDLEVAFENVGPGSAHLRFGELPPGSYRLELELEEARDLAGAKGREPMREPLRESVPLRVLPDVIEVSINRAAQRFLPGLVQAGVLQKGQTGYYREGVGWSIEPELVPYLRGSLWVGLHVEPLMPLRLLLPSTSADPLLPEFLPRQGHNVLGLGLRDVLDRPVRILVGGEPPAQRSCQGQVVDMIADFWWHDQAPEPIGEELLVEHGQPTRLRLRLPLPYEDRDRPELRLALAQDEIPAISVIADGEGASIATFDLPFHVWSVAARLDDLARDAYAEQTVSGAEAKLNTPVGDFNLRLSFRTTRSTLRPFLLRDLGELPEALSAVRLVPVLGPDKPFAEPVPVAAPERALFRPQEAVAVRNIHDFLLQDRELTCGEVRAIVTAALPRVAGRDWRAFVHADDPLAELRLRAVALLPAEAPPGNLQELQTGMDYFQAHTCCRLLGLLLANDPELFRLPMGCELELAAFGTAPPRACNGPAAAGRHLRMSAFVAAAERLAAGHAATAEQTLAAGDFAETPFPAKIGGLDFGVREWVADLPAISDAKALLSEWIRDHERHVRKVTDFASGAEQPPPEIAGTMRTTAVVRGLALGELDGLIDRAGRRLVPGSEAVVDDSVPGVLRTEQMRRDGRDLLSTGLDPRLRVIGFRVTGTAALVARLRGRG